MLYTKTQFHAAVASLIGAELHASMKANGYNPHDFCREVAQRSFVGKLNTADEGALAIVHATASNLWHGDGCTGLAD